MASNTSRKTEFDSLRKALFHSPTALEGNQQDEPDWPLLTRLQVEHDTEVCMKNVQKEMHQQRLEDLKKKVDYLAKTDWKYTPAQKLIGLE
ncbi:uncharacterized protein LOC110974180 isoform X2 [Acanthaster planci]|uniref:Uncharacterized protein LOC110974180 isoform X2 n=1 Tax=Acanthaster planci TaxID=133434 RepID=A0A8B7XKJ1_ACAPL|nr:uncharacterized protein LOC110974180 isoform X2 [Acanthaster planci]